MLLLSWPEIWVIISGPVEIISICASRCARGGVRPSVNIGIFTSGDIPSNRHPPDQR